MRQGCSCALPEEMLYPCHIVFVNVSVFLCNGLGKRLKD